MHFESASKWIPILVLNFIGTTIGFLILRSEIRKRKQFEIEFTTIWFRLFSITCIASYFLTQIFSILAYIPGFCTFSDYLSSICGIMMYTSMAFYQLYRLYYCFANEQVHSNKGYPKYVFIVMGTLGVIVSIYTCISGFFRGIDNDTALLSKCGYNDKHQFYFDPIQLITHHAILPWYYFIISIWTFIGFDLLTLCLYMMKIWTFKKYATEEPKVYARIMSILHKIFILTMFYEVFFIFNGVIASAQIKLLMMIVYDFPNFCVCYSMYLMMDHNEKHYLRFLKIVYFSRLYWICCCWRHFVIDEINLVSSSINFVKEYNEENNNQISDLGTSNISVDHQKIEMPVMSIATPTGQ